MSERIELPPGWVTCTLRDVVDDTVSGGGPTTGDEFLYVDISSIDNQTKRIEDVKRLPVAKAPSRARQRLLPNDVVVSMTRPNLNAVALVTADLAGAIGSTGFCVLRPVIESRYVYYRVQSLAFIEEMTGLVQGALYPAVRPRDVLAHRLPLPPLAEQRRIVQKIEELFTELDAGVTALERVRANLKRYRAAVLKGAVEGALTADWRARRPDVEPAGDLLQRILRERRDAWEQAELARYAKSGKTPPKGWQGKYKEPTAPDTTDLPKLPAGWRWVTIDQLAIVSTGATPLRSKSAYYENGTIPWVTSGALNKLFVDEANEYITPLAVEETNAKVFSAGTLLIAMYGEGKTRGKVSELRIAAATNQACAALLFEGLAAPCKPYAKLFVRKNYDDIRRLSSGGVQPNLNLSIVRETSVPLPPSAEQEQIVAEVERLLSVVDDVEALVATGLMQAVRLRQSILKQAFEGKLVLQDPTDQPADVLVERIQREVILTEATADETRKANTMNAEAKSAQRHISTINTSSELTSLISQLQVSKPVLPIDLWQESNLEINEFYALLVQEVAANRVVEHREGRRVYLEAVV